MMERPLILITNDDSIMAKGIHTLAEKMAPYGDVYVVAPSQPRSGQSAAITVGAPLHIREEKEIAEGIRTFSVSGTPVDCIKLALHTIVPRRPNLVLSGINHGSNSGTSVTYSGTMGAVLEACMVGIPAVGFSLLHHSLSADFSFSIDYVIKIALDVLKNSLSKGICLNVNIPAKVKPLGIRTCRAARGHWSEEYRRYLDPSGKPFYWLTGRFVNAEPDAQDTDEYWLSNNYISIVPVSPDLTDTSNISKLSERFDCNDLK